MQRLRWALIGFAVGALLIVVLWYGWLKAALAW